ncbi:MAG: acyl-CoA dehydrogenase family protein [Solirubrobacteraceae bacterium]|nr:acyl-CoA dehydrogenase family protein [Solirubrobacteraceae bacterium]
MSPVREDLLDVAAQIADDTLFAHALEVDAHAQIPGGHFGALAQAGLFGIAGPRETGGLDLDLRAQRRVRETLAGGCLTTAFVWTQHQGLVRRLRDAPAEIRDAWLPDLCAGRRLGGLALAGLLPGPPQLRVEQASDGLRISGSAPAVSGWGYVDTLLVVARREPAGTVVYALVDCGAAGLHARPRELAALSGTRTVELRFHAVRVQAGAVVAEQPLPAWEAAGEGVRANGAFSIGVAARCARLCDEPSLGAEIGRCRDALDAARDGDELALARAEAALLATRASAYLVADRGSSALDTREHAQRLGREALFLLAFGQRPAIKEALLDGLRRA